MRNLRKLNHIFDPKVDVLQSSGALNGPNKVDRRAPTQGLQSARGDAAQRQRVQDLRQIHTQKVSCYCIYDFRSNIKI